MKINVKFTEIDGEPEIEIEIPDTCDSIKWAEKRRDASGKKGWDAIAEYEKGLAECLAAGIEVDIV